MIYATLCIFHNFMVRNTVDIVHDDQMNTLSYVAISANYSI